MKAYALADELRLVSNYNVIFVAIDYQRPIGILLFETFCSVRINVISQFSHDKPK